MARKQIRRKLKQDYESMADQGGYEAVGASWGLTGGMVWRMINEEGYWPTDPVIRQKIELKARELGIPVGKPGRKQDLFSMDPADLLWRLQNREEVM